MNNLIPKEILEIFEKVKKGGFEVYFVGGCVRDIILKTAVKDWDFATNATPEAILKLFPDAVYDNKFGTVGILAEIKKQKQIVEVTTYRSESEYKDRRHPEKVAWGKTIDEDLQRRDFTVNAISMDLIKGEPHFVDPYNGRDDLEKK